MKGNPAISFKVELNFFYTLFFSWWDPLWILQGFFSLSLLTLYSIAVGSLFLSSEQKQRSNFIPLHILENTHFKNELIFIVFYLISLLRTWHFYVWCFIFQWYCHHLLFLLHVWSQCCFVSEQAWLVPFIEEELLYSSSQFDSQFNLMCDWAVIEQEGTLLSP